MAVSLTFHLMFVNISLVLFGLLSGRFLRVAARMVGHVFPAVLAVCYLGCFSLLF